MNDVNKKISNTKIALTPYIHGKENSITLKKKKWIDKKNNGITRYESMTEVNKTVKYIKTRSTISSIYLFTYYFSSQDTDVVMSVSCLYVSVCLCVCL